MMDWWHRLVSLASRWFRKREPVEHASAALVSTSPPNVIPMLAMDITPPPQPRTQPRTRVPREPRKPDVWLPSAKPKRERKPASPHALRRRKKAEPEASDVAVPAVSDFDYSREGVEEAGTFYFRGSLLNDLPKYFNSLRRLKGADPDAYHLCATIGMSLLPARIIGFRELPAYWHDKALRPAFGAASFAEYAEEDNMLRLIYFQRIELPSSNIEPTHGQVYEVTAYFDDENTESHKKHRAPKWMRRHGFCTKYWVGVDDDGNVSLLRQLQIRHQLIHYRSGQHSQSNRGPNSHTNGNHTRKVHFTQEIPVKLWDYPSFLREWYRDDHGKSDDNAMARHYCRVFNLIASFANANDTGVRVSVTAQDGVAASFALDMKRSSYFFKDRDVVLTQHGKKARIFHVRRPHIAHFKDGRTSARKMCFPGLRRFPWAGYDVHITVPGLHHEPLMELMPEVMHAESARALGRTDGEKTKVVGKLLHDYLNRS